MRRVLFVDVLRLAALLQMINGHTLDAVLTEALRTGPGFERYRFVRGLVSVAFLVLAGLSFYLTTLARSPPQRADPDAVRRRFTRAGQIVLVGYALQVSWSGAYFEPALAGRALHALFRCEVLQCIGLSLIALELLTLYARNTDRVVLWAALIAAVLFGLGPAGELWSQLPGPSPLRSLAGHAQGSQFPLLPWAGYVFAGVVIGRLALPRSGETPLGRRLVGLLGVALLLAATAAALRALGPGYGATIRVSSQPWFVVQKLAVIAALLALLAWLTQRLRALPRWLTLLSGETLAIFVFHLQLIYGGPWALAQRFGRTLSLREALLCVALNLALSIGFAFAWRALKSRAAALKQALLARAAPDPQRVA
jgi:acyltransferase